MNELLHLYINNGISLFSEGENTVIAPKDIALKLLDIIKNLNIIIQEREKERNVQESVN